jgi:acyl-CoA reductase-like NAD-dependent aldehyde dehydrogenase
MTSFDNFINGEWLAGVERATNINPSNTNDVIGEFAQADAAQAKVAIDAAGAAFVTWSRSGIQQRFDCLDAIATEILARKDELGLLLAREEGKTLPEAIGEVARAGQIFKFYAGEVLRLNGELLPSVRPGIDVEVTREPLGVIGIITPWNFPAAIPAWKIAPALAYGNCVVFKPASLVPGSAWALAEIISRSGLPDGVFNLVMGSGSIVGNALLQDDCVRGVTFTGSVQTGAAVAAACSQRGAKYQLEMGGKNPMIILNDADIDTAISCALNGAYFSTGQRCTASSRLIVESSIHDSFVSGLQQAIDALKVDDALKEGTHIGPVVDQSQLDQDLDYLRIGTEEGATLLTGGERLVRDTEGFYLSPALFVDTNNDMRINQEEIFGPVASVIRVADEDEAISVANDTPFGLSAGICTTSLKSASRFKRDSQAGMVMVNLPTAGVDYHVPFGGSKASSYGSREQGRYAAEFYTTVKTAYVLA